MKTLLKSAHTNGTKIEVRIQRETFHDREVLDLRKYVCYENGEFQPTRKGVSIPVDEVANVIAAMINEMWGDEAGTAGLEAVIQAMAIKSLPPGFMKSGNIMPPAVEKPKRARAKKADSPVEPEPAKPKATTKKKATKNEPAKNEVTKPARKRTKAA